MNRTEAITTIVVALIGAGILNWVRDAYLARKAGKNTPSAKNIAEVDASLVVVAKARDELQQDNTRLRQELAEERASHNEDRDRWAYEKARLRDEIDQLEAKLRGLLREVEELRTRTATP